MLSSASIPQSLGHPMRTWILVLLSVFATEGVIMLVLPGLFAGRPPWLESLIDASTLTLVIAPLLWVALVRPLRQLTTSRGALLRHLFDRMESERSRLARDLHDEIGQHLTTILVGLRAIEDSPDLPAVRERLGDLRQAGAMAHEEIRRLARGLRPGVLEELGLSAAIERMCEDFQKTYATRLSCEILLPGDFQPSPEVSTAIYRIAQESLTNIARHAQASEAKLCLEWVSNRLRLVVSDNGRGCDTAAVDPNSFGLVGMRERATACGGTFNFESSSGDTGVMVEIPVEWNNP